MKKHLLLVSLLCSLFWITQAPLSLGADGPRQVWVGLTPGVWKASYFQDGNTRSYSNTTDLNYGFQVNIGGSIGHFFLEWAPSYYFGVYGDSTRGIVAPANSMFYYALWRGNLGFHLPLGIDAYAGSGVSNISFVSGTESHFSGPELRFGGRVMLYRGNPGTMALKAEFTRMYINDDEACALPSGISSHANVYFVGLELSVSH